MLISVSYGNLILSRIVEIMKFPDYISIIFNYSRSEFVSKTFFDYFFLNIPLKMFLKYLTFACKQLPQFALRELRPGTVK